MEHSRIINLLQDYLNDKIALEDEAQLNEWFKSASLNEFEEILGQCHDVPGKYKIRHQPDTVFAAQLEQKVDALAAEEAVPRRTKIVPFIVKQKSWLKYAAIFVLAVIGTWQYWALHQSPDDHTSLTNKLADVKPGHKGAILKLANGKSVILDSLKSGLIAVQAGTLVKLTNGQVDYQAGSASILSYNTMITPKGREFNLILPDGSRVWLNAASSITYPTAFVGAKREVKVTGEAYFEVTKDKARPFIVKLEDETEVQVFGTHFNVNTYKDDGFMKTTLLEGSVRVTYRHQTQMLEPGQQAKTNELGKLILINKPDIDQVMAWKNGYFNFDGYDVRHIMREIGRWYDLDVVYETVPANDEFAGGIQRDLSLSQLMSILKKLNIRYHVEGKKLIVTK